MVSQRRLDLRPLSHSSAVIALVVLIAAVLVFLWPTPGAGAAKPQRSYLALGDSLAFGFQQAKFNSLLPNVNPEAFDTGYVDDFAAMLRERDPSLQVVNDGCPGETTDSYIEGPCEYQLSFPLHHPYAAGVHSSQRMDALSYLNEHRKFVNTITIDLGANDALHVSEGTCKFEPKCIAEHAPALFEHVAVNLGRILGELRAAAPHTKIVVLGLYNPFDSRVEGGDQLTAGLNEVMARAASAIGASFADPLPVFNPPGPEEVPTLCMLTNICTPLQDIHPTDLGYSVLAGLIFEQFASRPPFGPPLFGTGKGNGNGR